MELSLYLQKINKYLGGRDVILHTDMGIILKEFPILLKKSKKEILENFCNTLKSYIYSKSIFIPTFNYDFLKTGIYDIENDIGQIGILSEYVSKEYNNYRTRVPVFNHTDISKNHKLLSENYNISKAFGNNSFYDWFQKNNGVIWFWGCDLSNSNTFLHHIESQQGISYRYKKVFRGKLKNRNLSEEMLFEYYVRPKEIEIEYQDQGYSILKDSKLLFETKNQKSVLFRSNEASNRIKAYLQDNEFCLLKANSKIALANYINNNNFIYLDEKKINIDLISDLNLEIITKGWKANKINSRFKYVPNMILGLLDLANNKEYTKKDVDFIVIIPSYESCGLSILSEKELKDFLKGKEFLKWKSNFFKALKKLIDNYKNTKFLITSFILPSQLRILVNSNREEMELIKELSKQDLILFDEITALGGRYKVLPITYNLKNDTDETFSEINYLRFRSPFSSRSRDEIRSEVLNYIQEELNSDKKIKAISVDLDNTLWKGVAAEEGASLSKDYPDNIHIRLQILLKKIKSQGIFLTISSKNELSTIKETFLKLKTLNVLNLNDFSDIQASWEPKSLSIKKSASKLNISTDSFLHIDDSAFECNEIYSELPKTKTIHFSYSKAENIFKEILLMSRIRKDNIFDSDTKRIEQFRTFEKLKEIGQPGSKEEYLKEIKIKIKVINNNLEKHLFRTEQLFSKTNQFNNTHNRYKISEIREKIKFKELFLLEYSDKVSSPEICAALIINKNQGSYYIESYVLSCRFFSRGLEYVFLENSIKKILNDNSNFYFIYKKENKNFPFFKYLSELTSDKNVEWENMSINEKYDKEISLSLLSEKSKYFSKLYSDIQIL